MNERLPPSLVYILIYNPTLSVQDTSNDDEDAQEEAQILFYTSREHAVTRDRMLRHAGLAKALVAYSDIFALGRGCDNVRTQTKRLVQIQPEPNYWMHACVDLAQSRKPSRNAAKAKGKDPHSQAYYHHQDSVHDSALRNSLLEGYEEFKLLHGPFTSIFHKSGTEGLQTQLEHFFTPWAWKWDLEIGFCAQLGPRIHPLNSSLANTINSFFKDVPSNGTPLLLSSSYIIYPTKPSTKYPPSLPAYLLSLIRTESRHASRRASSKLQKISNVTPPSAPPTTRNTLKFLNTAGDSMDIKKWTWPEFFTFSKNKPPQNKLGNTGFTESGTGTDGTKKRSPTPPEGNQHATNDANLSHIQTPLTSSDTTFARAEGGDSEGADTHSSTKHQGDDVGMSDLPSNMTSTPGNPTFSNFKVYLPENSDPLVVRRRCVLHLSKFELMLAIVMDDDWHEDDFDQSLYSLQQNAPAFLQGIRRTIDIYNSRSTERGTASNIGYAISPRHSIVSVTEGFSTMDSQFFQSQELLARDTDTIEVYSRTSAAPHWVAARRGLGFNEAGSMMEGEAYLEVTNKEASLVDADNDVVSVVRQWIQREG